MYAIVQRVDAGQSDMANDDFGSVRHLVDHSSGIEVELIDFGGTITRLIVPDRSGNRADVLLGCPTLAAYTGNQPHFNCLVGRYSNRMTNARFELDGETYELDANIPPHHLHGGRQGFGRRMWTSETIDNGVRFSLQSADGEGGYPGELQVRAVYTLVGDTLRLVFEATTTKPTPVSLTSHPYFNLSGIQGSSIADQVITVDASAYLPVSTELTQQGIIAPVADTAFDLRAPVRFGDRLDDPNEQVQLAGGFDHTFAIDGDGLRRAARVVDPSSGRRLTVMTDQPGVQLYTSNMLGGPGKDGVTYGRHQAFCLETQQFPDAPNHANYPDPTLRPGDTFRAITEFTFDSA